MRGVIALLFHQTTGILHILSLHNDHHFKHSRGLSGPSPHLLHTISQFGPINMLYDACHNMLGLTSRLVPAADITRRARCAPFNITPCRGAAASYRSSYSCSYRGRPATGCSQHVIVMQDEAVPRLLLKLIWVDTASVRWHSFRRT